MSHCSFRMQYIALHRTAPQYIAVSCRLLIQYIRSYPTNLTVSFCLWYPKANYVLTRVRNSTLSSHVNPVNILVHFSLNIHFNIVPSSTPCVFISGLQTKNVYAFLTSTIRATCCTYPILFMKNWMFKLVFVVDINCVLSCT
jgi:hypothetical protein